MLAAGDHLSQFHWSDESEVQGTISTQFMSSVIRNFIGTILILILGLIEQPIPGFLIKKKKKKTTNTWGNSRGRDARSLNAQMLLSLSMGNT